MTVLFIFYRKKRNIIKKETTMEHVYINQSSEPEMIYNALYSVDLSNEHDYPKAQPNHVDATYASVADDNITSNLQHTNDVPSEVKYVNTEMNCSTRDDITVNVSNTEIIEDDKYNELQPVPDISRDTYETTGNDTIADANNAMGIPETLSVHDVDTTYSVPNKNKSRDIENNTSFPKHFQVEASGDTYAMVSK